ncbi:MAG: hypothetical protein CMG69_01625 [Candidatus Marinimicrobia bacterium]|nr:hypothetical protein [Candidatus Neomarinimicrobiota bacterium]|tara:strand:- start:4491 stop:5423 length:933 start_codon:yes stop_codon:yes gene_type:complete
MRQEGLDPVILDAGDLFFSTSVLDDSNRVSEQFRANAILKGYEKIGCDAINVGQYELSAGLEFLLESAQKSTIPFISANLRFSDNYKLIFDPYLLIRRSGLTIGVIGLTNLVPKTINGVVVESYLASGRRFINRIRDRVDIVVLLVNSERESYSILPQEFSDADLIYTSGSTMMTRPMMKQAEEGPYLYSSGREGRYLNVTKLNIMDKGKPLVNVSYVQENMKYTKRKLDRLGDIDPQKTLDELYANQENTMNVIAQGRASLNRAAAILDNAVNKLHFQNVAMDKNIKDDVNMVAFVNESLSACRGLIKK